MKKEHIIEYIFWGAFVGGIFGILIGALEVILSNHIKGANPAGVIYGLDKIVLASGCCLIPGLITGGFGAWILTDIVQNRRGKASDPKEVGIGTAILGAAVASGIVVCALGVLSLLLSISCNAGTPGACG